MIFEPVFVVLLLTLACTYVCLIVNKCYIFVKLSLFICIPKIVCVIFAAYNFYTYFIY